MAGTPHVHQLEQATYPPSRDTPLDQLLGRVAFGDVNAFERLYARSASLILHVATELIRERAIAEEVTQEVLLEVWRTAPRYDPSKGSAATWLFTITRRRAIDRIRSEQAARRRDSREWAEATFGAATDEADAVSIRLDQTAALRKGLECLTALQYEAVTLAYYGGHTYSEVAALLGIPLPTVKARIRDGLIRLKPTMAPALLHA